MLGPPKTAFASATRGLNKSIDATDKLPSKPNDDEPRNDRFNFRDKLFRDKDFADRDRDTTDRRDTRDTRASLVNGRKPVRDDKEDWSGARPRRTFGQEEGDRRLRRGGESDRWDRGDAKDQHREQHREQQDAGAERNHRDTREQGRFPPRRDPQGRGRNENWFREGDGQDHGGEGAEEKTPVRHREWRRGFQNQERDRDWNRPAKHEQDPEWMDSSDRSHDARESHTQEDFQRWKERMKAGANQASEESKKENRQPKEEEKPADTQRVDAELFSRPDPTFQLDAGIDNFFGLWSERKANHDATPDSNASGGAIVETPTSARPAKASRFAGIFNAPVNDVKAFEAPQAQPPRPVSTDADQEGFQRILQMLGGNKSRNATPQAQTPVHARPPPLQMSEAEYHMPQQSTMSPMQEGPGRPDFQPYVENSGAREQNQGIENLLAHKTAKENRDTAFLLRLMQQSKISGQTPTEPQPPHLPSPGGHNIPAMHARVQGMPKTAGYMDSMATNLYQPEHHDPREHLRRRATGGGGGGGGAPGYFDELYHNPAPNHAPANPPGLQARPQVPGQVPLGLQRPPGLEQVAHSGWPNQQVQQGGVNHPMAPPGLPTPHNRNMNPNFQSGPPVGVPLPNERPAFQRGMSGSGQGGFGPPPGIMPPPGYMNMNAPPPSAFPPMPHGSNGMMGMPHGNPNHYGAPQPTQYRDVLDMLTQATSGPNDGGMAGRNGMGMMGPGGYR